MRWLAAFLVCLVGLPAWGHPMSRSSWSLRTAVQLAGDALDAVVVLEVPFAVVTKDLQPALEAAKASGDAARGAQQAIDAYAATHWERMGKGLALTVDGKAVPGSWKPRDNRLNGKGAVSGGFFMYIVEFVPEGTLPLDGDVTLVVTNTGYTDVPMVYSAMVIAGTGWTVASDSTKALLPDRPYDLNAPDFWIEDTALRTVTARYTRAP